MDPKVTVLMSVYNDIEYLRDSIESILNQSYQNFEFLIYDDGSSDGSRKLIEDYAGRDERIKLIANEVNRGLSYNLAEGVKFSKTPWIARMDADDIAVIDRLELQMNYIKNNPGIDILGGYAIDINELGNKTELRKVPTTHEAITSLIWTCPLIHPTVIFRKDSILEAGSYNSKLARRQDYDLWFRCLAADLTFANLNTPLIYYRVSKNYFKKNNFKVQIDQARMGWKGVHLVKSSPIAYVGIFIVLLKNISPDILRKPLSKILKKVDPRKK